jgi:flotillin
MQNLLALATIGIPAILFVILTFYVFTLRRIVPTNVVHIVQRGKNTVSYGVGKGNNVYYEFPSWLPIIGVIVRELPVSNFDVDLHEYLAYDKDRVPFVLDAKAFFHITNTNKAAEKVESFDQLIDQLTNVVKGASRSILAEHSIEEIMSERAVFGKKFTDAVNGDLQQWGVETTKNIELMDVRDAKESTVIKQIMAKRMSAIEMESRTEVAKNKQAAEQAELTAKKEIAITQADTDRISGEAKAQSQQLIGIANALAEKKAGIAKQEAAAAIALSEKDTAEKKMEVVRVNLTQQAEIDKATTIIAANRDKEKVKINAEAEQSRLEVEATGRLNAQKKDADGEKALGIAQADIIEAKGKAEAEAEKLKQLASVAAQAELAKEIGNNQGYQNYLIKLKEVEVSQVVGVEQYRSIATAMSKSETRFLINSGDVHSGVNKFMDLFTSKGASQVNGLIEGLKQTKAGAGLANLLEQVAPEKADAVTNN